MLSIIILINGIESSFGGLGSVHSTPDALLVVAEVSLESVGPRTRVGQFALLAGIGLDSDRMGEHIASLALLPTVEPVAGVIGTRARQL